MALLGIVKMSSQLIPLLRRPAGHFHANRIVLLGRIDSRRLGLYVLPMTDSKLLARQAAVPTPEDGWHRRIAHGEFKAFNAEG